MSNYPSFTVYFKILICVLIATFVLKLKILGYFSYSYKGTILKPMRIYEGYFRYFANTKNI